MNVESGKTGRASITRAGIRLNGVVILRWWREVGRPVHVDRRVGIKDVHREIQRTSATAHVEDPPSCLNWLYASLEKEVVAVTRDPRDPA